MLVGKLYKASRALLPSQRNLTRVSGVSLYHQISPDLGVPLHHYILFPDRGKPPLLFIGYNSLIEAQIDSLGSRFYINHESQFLKKKGSVVTAGKFLHEERFVWVPCWQIDSLICIENEQQAQNL